LGQAGLDWGYPGYAYEPDYYYYGGYPGSGYYGWGYPAESYSYWDRAQPPWGFPGTGPS
jgi:hypothetical protein